MPTIQERIKERRTALNLTLLEIAEQLNVKEATVQRYESGEIKNIKHETIVALAKILKCSPQYLMGWSNNVNDTVTPVNSDNIYMRPVYNSAAAGFNVLAQDTIVDYIPTFISVPSEQELYIWVNVVGESMSPKIDEGDTLLIKRQERGKREESCLRRYLDRTAIVQSVLSPASVRGCRSAADQSYGSGKKSIEGYKLSLPKRFLVGTDLCIFFIRRGYILLFFYLCIMQYY